jgi:hypothetical protein
MQDGYGDGWNGGQLQVFVNNTLVGNFRANNFGSIDSFSVCDNDVVSLNYTSGEYEEENSYQLLDETWHVIFHDETSPKTGLAFKGNTKCGGNVMRGSYPCTALPIDTSQCIVASNSGFSSSAILPTCANYQGRDMWYAIKVPRSGNLSIEADSGSLKNINLAVWTANQCDNLRILACNEGSDSKASIQFSNFTPKSDLYIQVFGNGGTTGSFRLCVKDLGFVPLDSSELPIVYINTLGQTIVSDTKINGTMDIKYNGPGKITLSSDSSNIYKGNIGIEIRGASSSGYPQPPYGFETRDSIGANNDVSILGMPEENDWVLLSNYNDRSLVRNSLAFKIFNDMGNYSIKTSLCEVLIDSLYKGIYLLGEKIKRDKNRVNIAKLNPIDTTGDEVTGGYILQQNYWDESNSFKSNYSPIDHPGFDVHFVYEYPQPEVIAPQQKSYIASYIDSLEAALYSDDFADITNGYRKYMDVKSFIDYFIVNEVARNADGFKKSVFYNKDKFSNGGKLKAGPVWDFDWAWKNLYGCAIYETFDGSGWAHLNNDCPTDNYSTGWYVRLLQDSNFTNVLRCTYAQYRSNILDTIVLFAYIDSIKNVVQHAQERHFKKWPILSISGPAPELGAIANTYNAETDTLKTWIIKRLKWLDANLPGKCTTNAVLEPSINEKLTCYPNPTADRLLVKYDVKHSQNIVLKIMNGLGQEVMSFDKGRQESGPHTSIIDTSMLTPGIYVFCLKQDKILAKTKFYIVR